MSNLNLWQIGTEYQRLLPQLYDFETGEVNMDIQAQLDALEPSAEKKCIAVQSYVRKMQAEQKELEFLRKQIEDRESAYQREIDRLENYLMNNMKRCGIKEIKCPQFTMKIKENPYSTEIVDKDLVPKQFIKVKTIITATPDKNEIKEEFLNTGIQVPGTFVSRKEKLVISIDKI